MNEQSRAHFCALLFAGLFRLRDIAFSLLHLRLLRTVQGLAEDEKPLIQELRGEIQQHVYNRYHVFVPRQAAGQVIPQKGGQGREDHVVGGNLCHGHGYVSSGLEGKLSVQS